MHNKVVANNMIFFIFAIFFSSVLLFFTKQASAYCYEMCDDKSFGNQPSIYYCPNQDPNSPNPEDCSLANRQNCYWSGWVWHTGVCWTPDVCTVNQQSCIPGLDTCKGVGCKASGYPICVEETACSYAQCVPTGSGTGICVVPSVSPTPTPAFPEPFLDLPWDYEGRGLSFNESALNMTSFFDHEYPLLSDGLGEPSEVINFRGPPRKDISYSSHNGYDYAKLAKVNINDPVLAAASGIATYVNSCSPCGNMILIDHGNSYQTRYLHLQKDGLIISDPNGSIKVDAGQPIGKVGATGNVSPPGDQGAHIHFGVFQDKNHDGNFNDNVPDGVTDPFGWQSKDDDPWPAYSFLQNGINKTGNKSYYLWKKKLDNLDAGLSSNGGVFNTGRYTVSIPEGATSQNLSLEMQSAPQTKPSDSLVSIGSVMEIITRDILTGEIVNFFEKNFSIFIDFSQFDLSRFKAGTLSIYSSTDGVNWIKENTSIDLFNHKATAYVNHLTRFALMAERKDIIPPTTSAILDGQQGQPNWFKSDVQVNLNAVDNADGLGVDYTLYKKDEWDWETYISPIIFTNEGHHKISFYSVDKDENIEDIKTTEFDIDKTSPEADIKYDLSIFDTQITGKDSSGSAVVTVDKISSLHPKYTVSDQAGNTLILNIDKIKLGKQVALSIKSLQYNNNPVKSLDTNVFFSLALTDKAGVLKQLDQYYSLKNDKKIFTNYSNTRNTTQIYTKNPGSTTYTKEEKPGIVLLKLTTDKGTLKYSY